MLDGGPQPAGEAAERLVERDGPHAVLPPGAEHAQRLRLAVVNGLDAADHAVAAEDRQHVVAVLALRLRHVHLEAVEETPQRMGAVAIGDELVERRQEGRARARHCTVFGVRVREPLSLLEPHAAGAEPSVLEDRLRLVPRHLVALGVPGIGEVPEPRLAAASADGHLAARVQHAEHQAHLALAPPAVRVAARGLVILDLAREERPALLELAKHVAPVRGGPEEGVPLDELALLPEEAVELAGVVALAEPAPEHEMLRRRDARDRIELQEAQLSDRVERSVGRAVEELRPHGDPARLLDADLDGLGAHAVRSTRSRPIVRASRSAARSSFSSTLPRVFGSGVNLRMRSTPSA